MKCNKDCFNCPYPDCGVFTKPSESKQPAKPRIRDKAKKAAYMRAYRAANKEKLSAYYKEYFSKNKQYFRDYYKANREKICAQKRERYRNNTEKLRAYSMAARERKKEEQLTERNVTTHRKAPAALER